MDLIEREQAGDVADANVGDMISRERAISKLEALIIARRGWLSDGSAEIRGIDAAICELAALPSAVFKK